MAERKREDPATFGDLQDLAKQTREGIAEALKDTLGKVIPGPSPKGDEGGSGDSSSGDSGSGDGGSGDGGSGGGGFADFGFGGRWWGGKKD